MIAELIEAPVLREPAQPRRCNLLLHCGADHVSREELTQINTPRPTRSWQPIPHIRLLELVESVLNASGMPVTGQAHGLTHDGMRYFGLLEVAGINHSQEYHWVVGVRNSHDKRFPAGLVAGTQVLVCDNLSFAGEVKMARKHTRYLLEDLPNLVEDAIARLGWYWHRQEKRVRLYQKVALSDALAHDLVIRAVDEEVCSNAHIPRILGHWRDPQHEEFRTRNLWSLQNAFTEALKGNLPMLPRRSERLHALLDAQAYAG